MKLNIRAQFILLSVALVLLWVLDAVFDVMLSHEGTFTDILAFKVPVHDVLFRLLIIAATIGLIIVYRGIENRRRIAQGELRQHLAAIESSMDGIALFDPDHVYLFANDAYARISGFKNPLELVGRSFSLIYDAKQVAWIEENIIPALNRKNRWHGELPAHRKNGQPFLQEATISTLPDKTCVCVMRDITERKRQEEALKSSERFLSSIFDSIHDPFCIFDREYRIVRANEAYAELKNRMVDDLLDRTCFSVLEGREKVCDGCVIQKTLQSGDPCAKEKKVGLTTGETLWLEIYTYPLRDEAGVVTHVIEYTRDVTDRKKSDEERRRLIERLDLLSKTDGLTGLLNRRALEEQLAYEIDRARRYDAPLSIILCDMDNLKEINDVHGHQCGDLAVQLVAATLRNALRNSDIAGRYGGDEFLIIIPQTSLDGARSIAEKIRIQAQSTTIRLETGNQLAISVSMGITALGEPPDNADSVVNRVDTALYNSKNAGRNRITVA